MPRTTVELSHFEVVDIVAKHLGLSEIERSRLRIYPKWHEFETTSLIGNRKRIERTFDGIVMRLDPPEMDVF